MRVHGRTLDPWTEPAMFRHESLFKFKHERLAARAAQAGGEPIVFDATIARMKPMSINC